MATTKSCSSCGHEELEPGFVTEYGQSTYARWVRGPLEVGLFGGPKLMGKKRWDVHAFRCRRCSHLELFAERPR
jgi:ribosomal protein L37E